MNRRGIFTNQKYSTIWNLEGTNLKFRTTIDSKMTLNLVTQMFSSPEFFEKYGTLDHSTVLKT